MLISPQNSEARNISIQISEVPIGSQQPFHAHEPEQCYYIISGTGLVIIEEEEKEVVPGDAVYISGNVCHGIRNVGDEVLVYLTANSPPFDREYENAKWPAEPIK
jgi:mannose-6-phosphate isomerase-like protein (cupin superfamily)